MRPSSCAVSRPDRRPLLVVVAIGFCLIGCVPQESLRGGAADAARGGSRPHPLVTIVTTDAVLSQVYIEELAGDTLFVNGGGVPTRLALASIETVRVFVGSRTRTGAVVGAVVGTLAGGLVAQAFPVGLGGRAMNFVIGALPGIVLGMGTGALVGMLAGEEKIFVLSGKSTVWRRQTMFYVLNELRS